ncbi:MAG: 4-hydroxy-tetrahydrodipicolinate synthase [Lachnospiraceae bacterium]|jgi:4-hydroxy-tetrahydrodipicolinate synthase|nr:4-hydroxy-tetrahydrodipicolinate synthase [Eubacterium sp.]MCI6795276.1 4-hydroxy-tetrahydrodipicolinate synthase [Lachnospiraceae bacterium]
MSFFKGAGVAIITPMHDDGSVNLEKLDEILEQQIAEGTDAIVICGTTGESATLTEEEHLATVKHCVQTVNGRIPVIAGTGSNSTATAVAMSREAESYGVDGLLIVTPYYNKATQSGLIRHYTTIAEAVHTPIIMYNVPSRTGCNILPETAAYLCKNVENIKGIKAASGNISQITKTKALCGEDLEIFSGNDDQVIPIMSIGGHGVISVLSNVAPRYTHDMCQKMLDGNVKEAAEMQLKALDLIGSLFCEVNPIPVKVAMNMMGMQVGPLRGPLFDMEPANKERLRNSLINFGLTVTE